MQLPKRQVREGGGAAFLSLKDKQTAKGVFRGDCVDFYQHFRTGGGIVCPGDGCPLCAEGSKPSWKFRLNFITRDEKGQLVAKIFEQGTRTYNKLATLNEGFPLETTLVSVTRAGDSKNNTDYTILPAQQAPLSGKALAEIDRVSLHDLNPQAPRQDDPSDSDESGVHLHAPDPEMGF